MMKKIRKLAMLSMITACFSLTACSSNSDGNSSKDSVPVAKDEQAPIKDEQTPAQETDSTKDVATVSPAEEEEEPYDPTKGRVNVDQIESKCIADNMIEQSPKRQIYVYLPPSYETTDKKYPVVYFLHGYGDISSDFMSYTSLDIDKAIEAGAQEFIMVVLDGNNKTGGSFYENSPVTGKWEDFVTQEVVNHVDSTYRTLAKSESRCISGYSMGGYGAINMALKHPDIFGDVIVFCPGIYADGDINSMIDSWGSMPYVKISYGQVFSPNDDPKKEYANIPERTGTPEDNKIMEDWDKGYGDWERKINEYIALNIPLKGIQINYGKTDSFKWIPDGCKFFSSVLETNNIEHELNEFESGHIVPFGSMDKYIVPFLEKHLSYE